MTLLRRIGKMLKTLLEIWKDRSGGISAIIGGVSALFSIGSSLGLFGGKKEKSAPAPAPTVLAEAPKPTPAEPAIRQAQDRSRRRRASAVGRGGTILTSPLGLSGDEDVARPSLLGQ